MGQTLCLESCKDNSFVDMVHVCIHPMWFTRLFPQNFSHEIYLTMWYLYMYVLMYRELCLSLYSSFLHHYHYLCMYVHVYWPLPSCSTALPFLHSISLSQTLTVSHSRTVHHHDDRVSGALLAELAVLISASSSSPPALQPGNPASGVPLMMIMMATIVTLILVCLDQWLLTLPCEPALCDIIGLIQWCCTILYYNILYTTQYYTITVCLYQSHTLLCGLLFACLVLAVAYNRNTTELNETLLLTQ